MSNLLKNLRAFAQGALDENALRAEDIDSGYDFENDEEFMQECMALCAPTMLFTEILGESASEELDESVKNAIITLQDYMVGQGMINEAAAVSINNPKINVVRLNKKAQMNRLTSIIVLKMARKDNVKPYQKYKLGTRLRKENMAEMRKRYGAKAERLAKKLWASLKKKGKVAAVVDKEKAKK